MSVNEYLFTLTDDEEEEGEEEEQTILITIIYKSRTRTIAIPGWTTVEQLCKEDLSSLFKLRPEATLFKLVLKNPTRSILYPGPSDQEEIEDLFCAGSSSNSSPSPSTSTSNSQDYKIYLITSDREEVRLTEEAVEKSKRRDALVQQSIKNGTKIWKRQDVQDRCPYRINKVQVLKGLPLHDARYEILNRLANLPSVRSQMRNFKLSVGFLGELHPKTHPGLLGLNENSGQIIRLRIFTDDMKSIRPLSMLRRVLSHELAHNKFGPHNNDFKAFDSEIHKGMIRYDEMQKNSANRLGGDIGKVYEPESKIESRCKIGNDRSDRDQASGSGRTLDDGSGSGSGSGGSSSSKTKDPRKSAAEAAIKRSKNK